MDKAKTCMVTSFKRIYGFAKEQLKGTQKVVFLRKNNSKNSISEPRKITKRFSDGRLCTSISCDREEWYATDLYA